MAGGDLKALRDRLRAATGPNRELDARIEAWEAGRTFLEWHAPYYTSEEVAGANGGDSSPVTASIDAALALCERKLPGAWFRIDRAVTRPEATRWRVELADSHEWSWAPTAPLAILIALLEAMIGKETGDG